MKNYDEVAREIVFEFDVIHVGNTGMSSNNFKILINAITIALQSAYQDGKEASAKIADSHAEEIINMQTGLRTNPGMTIADEIRKL